VEAGIECFRAYDIRGVVPQQLDAELARSVGQAAVLWRGIDRAVVGRDARLTSPALTEALIDGLRSAGVAVLDVGIVTTPMLNFAAVTLSCYGFMVTASHNPKQYNGIKIVDSNAQQIYDTKGLMDLEQLVRSEAASCADIPAKLHLRSILVDYQQHLIQRFKATDFGDLKVKVVVDCSNGVGGLPMGVLESLGINYTLLNHIPNGEFPNHGCDTLLADNFVQLQACVRETGADLGLMLDGDADRVVFVDETGQIVPVDLVFVLLARQALAVRPGRVFYDLRFSRVVKEEIVKAGGIPLAMRVGNPFYKEALRQHDDGLLAAELSGHILYKENFGIDDALFATLKLLQYLASTGAKLSSLLSPLKRYASSGEQRIETDEPAALLDLVRQHYRDGRLSEQDGVTVEYADWWFNLRASNTEPVAKLVVEAADPERLSRACKDLNLLLGQSLRYP